MTNSTPTDAAKAIKMAMAGQPPLADGRRERSLASRRKILEAMVDLVAAGNPDPSAAAVADKAGVGLRSVFRHFQDKESILREIDDRLATVYRPILTAPYQSEDWQGRLDELIERRCAVNEAVVVFRLSGVLARYRSAFVVEKARELHANEKGLLDDILPDQFQTGTRDGLSIMVATSFDTWRFLRQDEGLSPEQTTEAIKMIVQSIVEKA